MIFKKGYRYIDNLKNIFSLKYLKILTDCIGIYLYLIFIKI